MVFEIFDQTNSNLSAGKNWLNLNLAADLKKNLAFFQ